MTDKQKIENWLEEQIKIQEQFNNTSELKINKSLTLGTCRTQDYIQLYSCIQKIADILELPVAYELCDLSDGRKTLQLSFMYHGFKFIQMGEDKE